MIAEAFGFALLASISPTALVVMAVFLGAESPRRIATTFAAGAMAMTVAAAVISLFILRAVGLNLSFNHDPRYGLRLGLGVLALVSAIVVSHRGRPAPEETDQPAGSGVVGRLVAKTTPRAAFAAGLILFVPSATFLAAVQVIASADTGILLTLAGIVIVVAVSAVAAWLPLLAYLVAPDATTARLKTINGWLRVQGRALAVAALAIAGVALVVNGALGLAGVI